MFSQASSQNSSRSSLHMQTQEDSLPVPDFHHQSLSSIPSTVINPSPSLLKIRSEQSVAKSQTSNQTHAPPISLQQSYDVKKRTEMLCKFDGQDTPLTESHPSRARSPQSEVNQSTPGRLTMTSTPSEKDLIVAQSNFKVVVRVRPPLERELESGVPFRSIVQLRGDHHACAVAEYIGPQIREIERQKDIKKNPHALIFHQFSFDYVYEPSQDQAFLYENTAREAVLSALQGYNATLLAYGQTGTGKTFTMEGFNSYSQKSVKIASSSRRGIVPRSMEEIFKHIQSCKDSSQTFMVRASYLQIYNEAVSDLLRPERTALPIREDKRRGVFVEGLSEWAVRSPMEVIQLLAKGSSSRKTAATRMNDVSSRSHAVFVITIEQMDSSPGGGKHLKLGKLNLVDLAGSERVRVTGATGVRLEESKSINKSLSALGNVIAALTDPSYFSSLNNKARHVPYRDSKLTRLLEDSLGGNCKTTMLAMISPAPEALLETLSTLKFATRAKRVRNDARINEDVDDRALIKKYEYELKRLREELQEKNRQLSCSADVLKLEQEKRQAEQDREEVIRELEQRATLYETEKKEKESLEEKIKLMTSQLLHGGDKIEDTPQFQSALEKKQRAIREEYEAKLQELEREREEIETSRAQADKYKTLLLKQRDIMVALAQRLNQRDDTILQLQEELDIYERMQKEQRFSSSRVMQLEKMLTSRGIALPSTEESKFDCGEVLIAGRVSFSSLQGITHNTFSREESLADTVEAEQQGPREVDSELLFGRTGTMACTNSLNQTESENQKERDRQEVTPGKMRERNVLGMLEGEAGGVLKNIINQVASRGTHWKGVARELERAVQIVGDCAEKLRGEGSLEWDTPPLRTASTIK